MSPGPWLLTWGSPACSGPVRGGRWCAEPLCDRSHPPTEQGARHTRVALGGGSLACSMEAQPGPEGRPLSSEAFAPSAPSLYQEVPVEVREAFRARGPLKRRRGLPG